jgi:hypothetical protein
MITNPKLKWMRERFLQVSDLTPEWWAYLDENRIKIDAIYPLVGILVVALCSAVETADGLFVFDFDSDGLPCVVIEARLIGQVDGVRDYLVCDMVAWPVGEPEYFGTAMGPSRGSALLGPMGVHRSQTDKTPIRLHRNPEQWLKANCEGSVILKPEAARWLNLSDVPLICEDVEHARAVRRLVANPKRKILVPTPQSSISERRVA